ncbi:hypothetical protein Pcinc_032383 [Petrolisthes cinctipes]|uniref:Uncharacterized protein n=1 Tax=Petrolisthes cinctipes TaxID=88211 RepID=A0AAE1JZA5_PETCI|nr:hypothetical protein Pcinc_032383 [Petrolisthes cinctipes]
MTGAGDGAWMKLDRGEGRKEGAIDFKVLWGSERGDEGEMEMWTQGVEWKECVCVWCFTLHDPQLHPPRPPASPSTTPSFTLHDPQLHPPLPPASPSTTPSFTLHYPQLHPPLPPASPSTTPSFTLHYPQLHPPLPPASPSTTPSFTLHDPQLHPPRPPASPSTTPSLTHHDPSRQTGYFPSHDELEVGQAGEGIDFHFSHHRHHHTCPPTVCPVLALSSHA